MTRRIFASAFALIITITVFSAVAEATRQHWFYPTGWWRDFLDFVQ